MRLKVRSYNKQDIFSQAFVQKKFLSWFSSLGLINLIVITIKSGGKIEFWEELEVFEVETGWKLK